MGWHIASTPAHRLPLFVGRAMLHVFDGMLSVAISFIYATFLFGVNLGNADLIALVVVVFLTAFSMTGFGLLIGGFSFYFREPHVHTLNLLRRELPSSTTTAIASTSLIRFPTNLRSRRWQKSNTRSNADRCRPNVGAYDDNRLRLNHVARKTGRLEAV